MNLFLWGVCCCGQRLGPSPHAPAQKEHEAATGLERQRFAERCSTQHLVLIRDGRRRACRCRANTYLPVFFIIRSIVLG